MPDIRIWGGELVDLGAKSDTAATSDAGTFSLIALVKRLLEKLTTGIPVVASVSVTSVGVNNAGGAAAVNVQDGGNALTVDGSVTIGNAGAGSAVNVQDGGNTLTVDGTVTANPTTRTVSKLANVASGSGDNTLLAADAAHYFVITRVTLQNESTTATTMLLKLGATVIERVLGQNQGDGVSVVYPVDARPTGAVNEGITLNLSGANSCGYTVHYYTV